MAAWGQRGQGKYFHAVFVKTFYGLLLILQSVKITSFESTAGLNE
jgi:hypothetical protein